MAVFKEHIHRADFNSLLNPKSDKAQAIEPRQSIIATNPEIAIMGLRQGTNGTLWQTCSFCQD